MMVLAYLSAILRTKTGGKAAPAFSVRTQPSMRMLMGQIRRRHWFVLVLPLLCLSALSCRGNRNVRTYHAPPPPDIKPTILQYVETDAFDEMFETLLTNQEPVILIQTETSKPDWGPRLNAWIAAWNQGGKVVDEPRRRVRMQVALVAHGRQWRKRPRISPPRGRSDDARRRPGSSRFVVVDRGAVTSAAVSSCSNRTAYVSTSMRIKRSSFCSSTAGTRAIIRSSWTPCR